MPFEYEAEKRNYSLDTPQNQKAINGLVQWESVDDADGYGIFRKSSNGAWVLIQDVSSDVLQWDDGDFSKNDRYTVAAYTKENDIIYWGKENVIEISK